MLGLGSFTLRLLFLVVFATVWPFEGQTLFVGLLVSFL